MVITKIIKKKISVFTEALWSEKIENHHQLEICLLVVF